MTMYKMLSRLDLRNKNEKEGAVTLDQLLSNKGNPKITVFRIVYP
jgi:hypothetical protein